MKTNNWRKGLLIGFFALVISTLGIQASDEIRGVSSRLSSTVIDSVNVCDRGSVFVSVDGKSLCFDKYEASPSYECPYTEPNSEQETLVNLSQSKCIPESKENVLPWRFVTYTTAQQLCARAGKRLPTNNEWYKSALSTTDPEACFSNDTLQLTGVNNCSNIDGVRDMVGNVWEWMSETIKDGNLTNRNLPESGYVRLVDSDGVILETSSNPNEAFAADYAWVNKDGVRGILRGGFYGSGSDGGIFSQNLTIPLNFSSAGVGFRCVKDLL